jgi:hypothetical protein
VTCVVDSAVTSEAIGRFVLMADAAKMDRSSKDVRPLHFIGSNRNLMHAAQNDIKMALNLGIFSVPLPSFSKSCFRCGFCFRRCCRTKQE